MVITSTWKWYTWKWYAKKLAQKELIVEFIQNKSMTRCQKICVLFISILAFCLSIYEWSFQQRIVMPSAGPTYGKSQSFIVGRGFQTLVTGYDSYSPGLYVHTCDDGYVRNHQYVWSQTARLVPSGGLTASDNFGMAVQAANQTIIVSAPYAGGKRGFIYVFNGTLRHWSQVQRLQAVEAEPNDFFGMQMSLHKDRLIIGAQGTTSNTGAVYIFERASGGLYWSRQGKLYARGGLAGNLFGEQIALYDTTAVISSRSDTGDSYDEGTGGAYVFQASGGQWSQQQKLIAVDMYYYHVSSNEWPLNFKLDLTLGNRFLGPSLAINNALDIMIGIQNIDTNKINKESVYIFSVNSGYGRWSLQQKLFGPNDTTSEIVTKSEVYSDAKNTLYTTMHGPDITSTYIFKSFGSSGNGWSLQSRLLSYNNNSNSVFTVNDTISSTNDSSNINYIHTKMMNFSSPIVYGGTMLTHTTTNELQIRTQFHYGSCLLIYLTDHFLDGWDTAVLTIRAPNLTNDTFHPHCDQVNPFYIRYCPYDPTDEGVYIVKVFAATQARFYWELSYQVQIEGTSTWYRGDFATKMLFNFNATTMSFQLVSAENLIDLQSICYRCTTVARTSWAGLQASTNPAFWPLVVYGAPYYISTYQARTLVASGKVCHGIEKYECYQTLTDGVYTLRLGGGLFGGITGFPYSNAYWTGCGMNGTARDQFVFRIENGVCTAIQKYHYATRCSRAPSISEAKVMGTEQALVEGATSAPTSSVFGEPYVKGNMYTVIENQPVSSSSSDRSRNSEELIDKILHLNKLLQDKEKRESAAPSSSNRDKLPSAALFLP